MLTDRYDPLKGEMYQIMDKDGGLVGEDPNLPEELLRQMYWWMLYGRMADEKAIKLQRQGRLGTYAPGQGQEAAHAGPALAMGKDDWLFPSFRELTAYMIRGVPYEYNLMYFMGDPRSNRVPEGSNSLPIFVPVGTQVPIAAGAAFALKMKKKRDAVLCYMGDGATSEGDFHEGLNFAGVFSSPVVYIIQNNQWAISVPRSKQTASRTLAQKALAYGIPGLLVDGNDVLAMYLAAKEALERAKGGGGPTLIEAYTFRLMMHTTADDASRYRSEEEVRYWKDRDPIKRMRSYLQKRSIWSEGWEKELVRRAETMIKEAVEKAESVPPLKPEDLFLNMFSDMPDNLQDQLDLLQYYIETREIEEEAPVIRGGFP